MSNIRITATIFIIALMSGSASADIETGWDYGKRNVAPVNITHVYYDFEEGSNCIPFRNQYPDVATFLTVLSSSQYGADEPSYVEVGGSMCGDTRCYMNIYPYDNNQDWIYVVNGDCAFSPITGPDYIGGYYPGVKAHISFKPDTHYVSFLASTGGDLSVRLYDKRGNVIHYDKIPITIMRNGTEPSTHARFSAYIPETDIVAMKLSGPFNAWHIDDLIVGGGDGYLPDVPFNYSYVAERACELYGMRYHEYCLGFDYEDFTYAELFQFDYPYELEYWDPVTKTFKYGEGISDEGVIIWAYNYDAQDLAGTSFVKWQTADGMVKHDFKVSVDPADTQPGDVYFMDHDFDDSADFVGMVITPTDTGMDLIGSYDGISEGENIGVIYSKKSIVEDSPAFMGYRRLDSNTRGGHNPIPKGH